MTEQTEIAPGITIDSGAIVISFSRSGGPGGQNVNKLSTKAELRVDMNAIAQSLQEHAFRRLQTLARNRVTREDFLCLTSQQFRTQEANRAAVMDKLRELIIAANTAPKPRRPTKPSRGSKRRRLEAKKKTAEVKSTRREPRE